MGIMNTLFLNRADGMHSTQARIDSVGRRTRRTLARLAWLPVLTALTLAGCTHNADTPSNTGPSALGLDLKFTAVPDVLPLDGQSQSLLTIVARDSNGTPKRDVGIRVEIITSEGIVDIGRLSTKNVVTGGDGTATLTYTAPAGAPSNNSDTGNMGVTIQAIPAGNDYSNAIPRTVDIRLVPQGVILPIAHAPVPNFFFSPTSPGEGDAIFFDATSSIAACAPDPTAPNDASKCTPEAGSIIAYQWDFGNGRTGSGAQLRTSYDLAGNYVVKLTVVNDRGLQNTTSKSITVTATSGPTADFSFSPQNPEPGQVIFYDASASKAAPGRSIVDYFWNFGDGETQHGRTQANAFPGAQTWNVTLTVTDSAGQTGTKTQAITVAAATKSSARFSTSATAQANQAVSFDATGSTSAPRRSIVSYDWNFGDGTSASGSPDARPRHVYSAAGTYTVTLTVRDDHGVVSDTFTSTVTVSP
jgi:PKD repeat protein